MADWGIRISQEGKDVKTCTDQELILSSELNQIKVGFYGTTSGTVAHGLSYTPAYFSCRELGTATKWGLVGQNYFGATPHMTDTYFNAGSVNTRYYIFYQPGTGTA